MRTCLVFAGKGLLNISIIYYKGHLPIAFFFLQEILMKGDIMTHNALYFVQNN